jgi:ABC-type transport system substrate-binding protein
MIVVFAVVLLAACGGPPAASESPSPVVTESPFAAESPVSAESPAPTATAVPAVAAPTMVAVPTIVDSESASPTLKALRINLGAYHDNLDPQKAAFVNEIAILQLAYEGLTRFDPNGNVLPAQAERWSVAPDGKTITFTLRADLKRADGAAITARDFEASFKRLVDPRVAGEYNALLDDVVGAAEARTSDPRAIKADITKVMSGVDREPEAARRLLACHRRYLGRLAGRRQGSGHGPPVLVDPARKPQWKWSLHHRPD